MLFGTNVLGVMPPHNPVRIWDAGVQWCDLEKQRGVWDWSKLDKLVEDAGKRSIMIVLGHPPAWAAKGGPDGRQASWMPAGSNRPPLNNTLWKAYVSAVVTRYKGRVKYYQIWNEPADKRFYSGSWDELATAVKVGCETVKRIDPDAKTVSPPLQPRKQAGWTTKGKMILKAMKDVNYPFDVWSMHIYPQQGEGIGGFIRDCRLVEDALITHPKKPLFITECNFNLAGQGNPYSTEEQNKIKSQVVKACNALDIPRVYWYAFNYNNPSLIAITNF